MMLRRGFFALRERVRPLQPTRESATVGVNRCKKVQLFHNGRK
jgi:hypothetical protein